MGIALKEIIKGKEIEIKELSNKVICMDTSMLLYQFLTTIRQSDGEYFTDKNGNITSHLIGLNSRITKLIQYGLKLAFVFDGKSPELKKKEQDKRKEKKQEAHAKYQIAKEKKDFNEMKKYASRSVKITKDIIEETKELIQSYGLPIIQAPSEAEAQASYMVKKGDAYAVATQDADALVFESPRMIKNLSLIGKHKRVNKLEYQTYKPELITLSDILNNIGIEHNQLIMLSILVGTDFNPGGIKGIGPKNALKLVKESKNKEELIEKVKEKAKEDINFDFNEIYNTLKNIETTDDYNLEWKQIDFDAINKLLVKKHNFSEDRINSTLESLKQYAESKKQKDLNSFFG